MGSWRFTRILFLSSSLYRIHFRQLPIREEVRPSDHAGVDLTFVVRQEFIAHRSVSRTGSLSPLYAISGTKPRMQPECIGSTQAPGAVNRIFNIFPIITLTPLA